MKSPSQSFTVKENAKEQLPVYSGIGFNERRSQSSSKADSSTYITGMPKRSLDRILHYLLIQHLNKGGQQITSYKSNKRHPYFLFQYHKNFQLINRLKGAALCLLQTQYAKKPRNPE